jgi:phospholipid/cholesterol/gamma-HCH transport system permease protein
MSSAHLEMTVRDGGQHVRVAGRWTLATTSLRVADLSAELGRAAAAEARWDCMNLEAIDSAGAMLLWRAWGRSMPVQLSIKPEHWRVFERIQTADHEPRAGGCPGLAAARGDGGRLRRRSASGVTLPISSD